jgi:hypothetical protein
MLNIKSLENSGNLILSAPHFPEKRREAAEAAFICILWLLA